MRIGFIGLGVMGHAMATHLVTAGHDVIGYDPTTEIIEGITRADNIPDTVKDAEIIISMLPNGLIVADVIEQANNALSEGSLWIDTSSADPNHTLESSELLAAQKVRMMDAPVSGAQWGAKAAELVFMCGGEKSNIERARPILMTMGNQVHHLGKLGAGHAMKTINNVITAMTALATAEGMEIGKSFGLSPSAMVDVLNTSTGQSWWSTERLKQDVLNEEFQDGFRLSLMRKDVEIAHELGLSQNKDTPFMKKALEIWCDADSAMGEGTPITKITKYVESYANQPVAKPHN